MKIILNIAKYIGAIATIAGAALWFDARFDAQVDNNKDVFDSIAEVKMMVLNTNEQNSALLYDVEGMDNTLLEFEREHKRQGEQINTIVWGLKNLDRFTPDDFEDIIDEMLKKQYVDSINAVMRSYKGEVVFEIVE